MGVGTALARIPSIIRGAAPADIVRQTTPALSIEEYLSYFTYGANQYPLGLQFSSGPTREEEIMPTYLGYAGQAYASSGPIFACMLTRAALLSQARFQWRQFTNGRAGPLFGTPELRPLEIPWPNGTTADLIVRLDQDFSLTGNFYGWRVRDGIRRMRPDWVTIILGSRFQTDDPAAAIDAEVIGYQYTPGGRTSGHDPINLRVEEVCHFTGHTPDPSARFRGMSWLTPILREIQADKQSTSYKQNFLEKGGPKTAISIDIPDPDEFARYVDSFKANAEGTANSFSTLFFNSGAPPSVATIGADLVQADYNAVQTHGETRICAAAGLSTIVAGLSDEAATYANYEFALKRSIDFMARPGWQMMAGTFQSVLEQPNGGAQLWYDERDIAALKEDIAKAADTFAKNAAGMKLMLDGGYEADSVTACVNANYDYNLLVHSGLPTVQLQQVKAAAAGDEQKQLPPPDAERSVLDELEDVIEGAAA